MARDRHADAPMADLPIAVALETAERRVFASAIEWPGWSRAGRTPDAALEALAASAERYRPVATAAGEIFPDRLTFEIVDRVAGNASTAFGVPAIVLEADRRPLDAAEAARLAAIVEAAWATFDRVAATAPAELRKGPRGGGRDRDRIVDHVNGADGAYAHEMGIRAGGVDADAGGVDEDAGRIALARRAAMLEILRRPSDGSPIGKRWTSRYAARRIAWHALDHAWEVEDRTEPG